MEFMDDEVLDPVAALSLNLKDRVVAFAWCKATAGPMLHTSGEWRLL